MLTSRKPAIRPPAAIRKRRAAPEAIIQVAVMRALRGPLRVPGVFAFAIGNGGKRSLTEASRFKAQGVTAGVPDLCIVIEGRAHFLELKAAKGRVRPEQRVVMRQLEEAGATCAVANSIELALETLRGWGAIK
jgi:hypothetical protein